MENKTKVVHCKIEAFDVYIGRGNGSIWGNPFTHKDGTIAQYKCETVAEAIEKYKEWLLTQDHLMQQIPSLKGKVLGCWCKTKKNPDAPCHGDVLAELADNSNN